MAAFDPLSYYFSFSFRTFASKTCWMKHTNWGKYPSIEAPELSFRKGMDVGELNGSWIPRGMGRCYGDSSLGEKMLSSRSLNRFLAFDPTTGIVRCEAGVTYEDLLETFVPKGWFPPVTPGTKFVSMGGALASDVHGKNHHKEGSISSFVKSFDLMLASGEIVECSPTARPDLFQATLGGMGLTGMILTVTLQLKRIESAYIKLHSVKNRNWDELIDLFEQYQDVTYSVAWIDSLARGKHAGRGVFLMGEHATEADLAGTKYAKNPLDIPSKKSFNIPFDFPTIALNRLSMKAFNLFYYHKQFKKEAHGFAHYEGYFYPLDILDNWNRIYGKRGFTQYQFVIPPENGREGMRDILNRIARSGHGSFLTVLKTFGHQEGLMNFPMKGYTLALDFPIRKGLFSFLDELDQVVAAHGGRVYLTKDARMAPEMLARFYPKLDKFKGILAEVDPAQRIRSMQSERLGMHGRQ